MRSKTTIELEETSIPEIMQAFSLSEQEARTYLADFKKKHYEKRERIFKFLKAHNPKIAGMLQEEFFTRRIASVASELEIPETTATALVITGEIISNGAMKILRKVKKKATPKQFQEMLGVTIPVPKDVLDALGVVDASRTG
jgi:hypothetical protein